MRKNKTKTGIIAIALGLSISGILSPILSSIGRSFPEASPSQIQLVFSIVSLTSIPVILFGGKLAAVISKKRIALFALLMIASGGLVGYFGHKVLLLLYIASGLMGSGIGLGQTMLFSIISGAFDEEGRAGFGGIAGAVFSVTGMLYSQATGFISDHSAWYNSYLLALSSLVLFAIALFTLPEQTDVTVKTEAESSGKMHYSKRFIFYSLLGFFYMIINVGYNSNISSIADSISRGLTSVASTAITFYMLAGIPSGLLCSLMFKKTKSYYMAVIHICTLAGVLICAGCTTRPMLYLGSFLVGCGNGFRVPGNTVILTEMYPNRFNAMAISVYNVVGSIGGFIAPYVLNAIGADARNCFIVCTVLAALMVAGHMADGWK